MLITMPIAIYLVSKYKVVPDPGVVSRVPGHHPRLQGWTQFQTTHWLDS